MKTSKATAVPSIPDRESGEHAAAESPPVSGDGKPPWKMDIDLLLSASLQGLGVIGKADPDPVLSCLEALAVDLNLCKRATMDACWVAFQPEELGYIFDRLEKRARAVAELHRFEMVKKEGGEL